MIRRSRITVRPNVKPSGRVPSTSRDASQDNPSSAQTPADLTNEAVVKPGVEEVQPAPSAPAVEPNNNTDTQTDSVQLQTDITTPPGDAPTQSTAAGTVPASGPQRRKRFTVLPNLARPRTPVPAPSRASLRTTKSPVKAPVTTPGPTEPSAPPPQEKTTSDSRGKRRLSGSEKQPKAQPKRRPPVQATPEPSAEPPEQGHGDVGEKNPSTANQKTEFSCPAEVIQLEPAASAENLAQSKEVQLVQSAKETAVEERGGDVSPENGQSNLQTGKKQSQVTAHIPLALKTINDPMDRIRLEKAKKLRELLKKEMNKDKQKEKHQRPKTGLKTYKTAKDHTKMTMRDLIYYLPSTNPMKSYVEDEQKVTETVLPSSPKALLPASPAVPTLNVEDGDEEVVETAGSGPGEEEPLLAPRVKVAEDGSLIIDEESLTVEVLRVQGPNPAEERDPIFERGSTTTYSSFRKGTYTKPWSNKETDMFFLAISMVGTDFSMIGQLFPHRARIEIKNKFKKEEKANSWRIDKAFKERRRLDLEFFNNLLEKILQDEEKRRKRKKDGAKASGSDKRKSAVRRKRVPSSAGSEEEESSDSDVMEGEKENEGISNDGSGSTNPISPRRKTSKKMKQMRKAEDTENFTEEGQPPGDRLQDPDPENREISAVQPAQLKGRSRRPAPTLLRKWRNPPEQKEDKDTSAEEESGKTKVSKKSSSDVGSGELEDSEVEEEPNVIAVQEHILNKPTRSGRIPKLSQHVMRAVADEDEEEVEQQSSSTPPPETRGSNVSVRRVRKKPGPSLKQGMPRSGKSRLVMLRASAAEDEEDDDEDNDTTQDEEQYLSDADEEENQAFVPMGLRTQPQVQTEVEETMEELDMCVNVPDVLGISQNALCPESSCARSLGPGSTVPCEHQLDLLVDVIEFLAPEHMEVSEESYTEAARTLLTIGNSAQLIPSVETHSPDDVIIIEEPSRFPQQDIQQEVILETTEATDETFQVMTSDFTVNLTAECKAVPESDYTTFKEDPGQDSSRAGVAEASSQGSGPLEESAWSHEPETLPKSSSSEASDTRTSEQTAPQTRRNRLPKPKPNLGRASRPLKVQEKQKQASSERDTDSVQKTSPTSSCRTTTEEQLNEPEPLMETSVKLQKVLEDSGEALALSTAVIPQPELSESNSKPSNQKVSVEKEENNSQASLTKKQEDSELNVCEEGESVEAREEKLQLQQPHSSGSASSLPESSVQPSQPIRRCRGPKPKPNLVRSSRTTNPLTQKKPAQPAAVLTEDSATVNLSSLTDPQRPEHGGTCSSETNISQHQVQQETSTDSQRAACSDDGPEECSGAVSKQDSSGTSAKKTASIIDDDDDDDDDVQIVSVQAPEPMANAISGEPVYILSLTEVPPIAPEKEDKAKSEHLSEPLRAADNVRDSDPAGNQASPLVLSDMLAPISESEEENEMDLHQSEGVKEPNRENEEKRTKEDLSQVAKRDYSHLNQKSTIEEGFAKQQVGYQALSCKDDRSEEMNHPAKRQKLPERGRRAKLQVKPNPVQRKGLRTQPAAAFSLVPVLEEASSDPLLTTLAKDTSSTSDSPAKQTNAFPTAPSLLSPKQTPVPSALIAIIEASPTLTVSQSTFKDIVEQENLPETPAGRSVGAEDSEPSVSGVELQPAHQITPLATVGPLTRPGRRPRGFLSFMSSTSTQGPSSASRGSVAGPQKPVLNTSRFERRRAAPGPLTSASRPASISQKAPRIHPSPASSTQSPIVTSTPASEVNAEPETSDTNSNTEEEPTSISAYFFSDIFTMVDEQEDME